MLDFSKQSNALFSSRLFQKSPMCSDWSARPVCHYTITASFTLLTQLSQALRLYFPHYLYEEVYIPRRKLKSAIELFKKTLVYDENNSLLEWTVCFVTLQTVFMLERQHYTLKKSWKCKKSQAVFFECELFSPFQWFDCCKILYKTQFQL